MTGTVIVTETMTEIGIVTGTMTEIEIVTETATEIGIVTEIVTEIVTGTVTGTATVTEAVTGIVIAIWHLHGPEAITPAGKPVAVTKNNRNAKDRYRATGLFNLEKSENFSNNLHNMGRKI